MGAICYDVARWPVREAYSFQILAIGYVIAVNDAWNAEDVFQNARCGMSVYPGGLGRQADAQKPCATNVNRDKSASWECR